MTTNDSAGVPSLGATVTTPVGSGVVTDRDMSYAAALVRLDRGTVLDTTHGQWWPFVELTVTGFDPDASVWFATRMVPASEIPTGKHK